MKTVNSLEYLGVLLKCVSEKTEREAKEQKGGFPGMI